MIRVDAQYVPEGSRRFTMTDIRRIDRPRSTPVLLRVVVKCGSSAADSYANLSVLNDRGWIAVVTHAFDSTPIGRAVEAGSNTDDALSKTVTDLFAVGERMFG